MNEQWVYVGAATNPYGVSSAVVAPRWNLTVGGRKPRGEWHPAVLELRRDTRDGFLGWLARTLAEKTGPVGQATRLRVILDVGESGAGDLLARFLRKEMDRLRILRRLNVVPLDVTPRDVERTVRGDGALVVPRRLVLLPLVAAIEADVLSIPRGRLAEEMVKQSESGGWKPGRQELADTPEDLLRAVAVATWALDEEGGAKLTGFSQAEPLMAY